MKKSLLSLLFFSCVFFLAITGAKAQTFGTASNTGFYATTLTASATNQGVFGFSYKATASYKLSEVDFATSVSQTYFSNYTLYESTTNSLATAEGAGAIATTPNGDFFQTTATDLSAYFDNNLTVTNGTTYYFFLVADFTLPAASTTFTINSLSATRSNGTVYSGSTTAITYTITVPPPVTITATSLNTSTNPVSPTAGLTANPIAATGTKLPVYGLQFAFGATGASTTITAVNFTQVGGQNNNYYMANAYLYSNTTATWGIGTNSLVQTIAGVGATTALNFTGLTIAATAGAANKYYFVLIDYTTPVTAAANFELNVSSVTAANGTPTGTPAGYLYNFSALTLTATSLNTSTNPTQPTAGLTANPIAATGTKLPVYGLQIAASGTGPAQTITALNFTQAGGQNNNYYMANAYLYSNTTGVWGTGTNTLVKTITGVGATTTLNFTGLTIPVSTGQTLYYFVLIDYNTAVTATANFQLNFASATGATVAGTPAGYVYNFNALAITATSLNTSTNPTQPTAGLTPNPISATATGLPVYGLQLASSASGPNKTITALNFTQAGGQNNNYYMANAYLYSNTTGVWGTGTSTLLQTITGVGATTALNFTGLNISVAASQTLYYFVLIDYNTPTAAAANFQLNFASATGATVTGTPAGYLYNFSALTITATSLNTSTNPTQPTAGLTANPIGATGTGLPVYGLQLAASATGPTKTITALNFTQAGGQNNNYYMANAYLYSNTTGVWGTGTSTLLQTITGVGATTALNFTGLNISVTASQTLYYFVLIDYNTPTAAAANFQLNFTSATGATVTGTPAGYQYNFTSLTITATSLNTSTNPTQPTAGLTPNPIASLGNGLPIYGMQLTASASGPTRTLTTINFTSNSPQGGNNYYFSKEYLYSSTSSNFPGVGNAGATLVSTVTTDATDNISFTGLNIPVAANATLYYFVVVDYTTYIAAAAATYQLNFTSAVGATIAAGAGNTGYNYNVTSPTYAIANNTSGIPANGSTYYYGSTGDVLESFGVTSTGPAIFNGFTLKSYVNGSNATAYTTYFSNLTVYTSSNPSYSAALAGGTLTSVPFTTTGTTTLAITLSTGQALSATPIYYFVVADFTLGDNLFTSTTAPTTTFQFRISAASANVPTTTTYPLAYTNTYNLASPVALSTATTTGLATATQLSYNQTQVGILGFSVTATQNETIAAMNFSAAISSFNSTVSTFFSNVNLYVSTTNNFAAATQVTGATVSSLSSTSLTFTISGLSQTITAGTTLYYFIKADYTAPTNYQSTFQLSVTNVINTAPTTFTCGAPISGITYTCSPAVLLGTATTTGLAANPITTSATGVGIFGFSLFSGPGYTFTTFNLSSVQPAGQYLNTNFANYQLYVNTANNFAGATQVTGATFSAIANSNTLTISGLTQAIPAGTTYYYFIKADYTSPAVATTYELNLNSVATATNTYTTGAVIYGTNYTLTGPLGVYYFTGKAASVNWETANNWLNAYTGTASGYPGLALNTDIAVFSPTYETYYGTEITTSKTIGQILVIANNTTPFLVEIKNGLTCTITNGITLGDAGQLNQNNKYLSQLEFAEVNNNGTGIFYIGGTSSLYNDGSLIVEANTVFNSGSTVSMYGTTADPAFLGVFTGGGTASAITANNVTFNCTGPGGEIYGEGGTFSATSSTLNFGGFGAQMYANGATMTLTGCTVNATGTSNTNAITGLGVSAGSMTATTSTLINLGTSSSNGAFTDVNLNGGTFTLSGASTVNLIGQGSNLANDYYIPGATSTLNITGSTVNMGSLGGSDGVSSEIYNSSVFNFNAASIINMNGANSEILNTSTTYGGTTYPGIFIANPTSVINPTSTSAVIYNTLASNYFTLESNTSATATIGTLGTGATIVGQYNVQRYLNGGATYLRNYRMLSSPVNMTNYVSSGSNLIDLSYIGATTTIPTTAPTTFYGAFIGGPDPSFGGGVHTFVNPLMYLYQESIAPGSAYNAQFTSGKNVGVVSLNAAANTVGTKNTALGAGSMSPPSQSPSIPSTATGLPSYDNGTGVAVPPGNGYITYYVGNNQDATPSSPTAPTASTVSASGYINQGQVQLYLWGSDSKYLTNTYGIPNVRLPGITVIGNPYPSTIDLEQVWYDNSHAISVTLYQLDNTTQQFDTYNASTHVSSTSVSAEYIGSGLGFYVHTDSLGNTKQFYFQEDQKTPSATGGFYPPLSNFALIPPKEQMVDNVNVNKLIDAVNPASNNTDAAIALTPGTTATRFTATGASIIDRKQPVVPFSKIKPETPQVRQAPTIKTVTNPAYLHLKFVVDSVNNDEVALAFNSAWSDKYDSNDSFDLDGQSNKVYLSSYTSDGVRTSVNALGNYTGGKRVKLFVKASTAGIFQVQMTDIKNFDTNDYSVFLMDNLQKDSLDLTLYKSYNFNYAPGTANDSTRFVLVIEHKPVPYYALLTFDGTKVNQGILLNWKVKNESNTTNFVLQKLGTNSTYYVLDSLQSDNASLYSYVDQHPTLGNNTYRLQQTNVLGVITYSAPVTIGYNSTAPNGGLNIYPNPSRDMITVTLTTTTTAAQVATADIYNTSGTLIEHKVVNSNSFTHDISSYQLGVYIIELKNSAGLLVGKSKFVKIQ